MIQDCKDNISNLQHIFSKVFVNNNPFEEMFTLEIESKIILCPTNGYYLTKKQFIALKQTNKIHGGNPFYLSEIEGRPFATHDPCKQYPHHHMKLDNDTPYHAYNKIFIIFENALYASDGKWGIIISHEIHAVLGGSKEFISTFKELYPDWIEDQKHFIKYIEYWGKKAYKDTSWLIDYIKYING